MYFKPMYCNFSKFTISPLDPEAHPTGPTGTPPDPEAHSQDPEAHPQDPEADTPPVNTD